MKKLELQQETVKKLNQQFATNPKPPYDYTALCCSIPISPTSAQRTE